MNPFDVVVPSATHIPTTLSIILQVLAHVVAPSLLCQWFIVDMVRKVIATMKDTLELSLSPTCSIPLALRAKVAGDVLASSLHLRSLPGCEIPLTSFPSFLVRYRLHEGPKEAWEQFDQIATLILQEPLNGVSKMDLLDVLKTLCSETWGLPGNRLRVRQ